MKDSYFNSASGTDIPSQRSYKTRQQTSSAPQKQQSSYVFTQSETRVNSRYKQLPEEYSVFSEIENTFFTLEDSAQRRFLSLCLHHMKARLLDLYTRADIVRVLPKLNIAHDADGAIVLNWAYTYFRVYFNFESVVENSYYGIVAQSNDDSVFTKSGKLTNENYTKVIDSILQYVINNS